MQNTLTRTEEWTEKGNCYAHFGSLPRTLGQETIGIIGVGELGIRVASHFTALGSKVLLSERPSSTSIREGRTSFKDTLSNSTVIVIATSLTPDTRNLISDSELALLPSDALLINVARGEIVDEKALVKALKEKRIAGAATDVFAPEPAGRETSILIKEADGLGGRLIVSPHVAWYAITSVEKLRRVRQLILKSGKEARKGLILCVSLR